MSKEELLDQLDELFSECDVGDYSPVDDFIEENEADYNGVMSDEAFRYAIREGIMGYLEEHIGDVEMDEENLDSYLEETEDEDIQDFLRDNCDAE